MITITLFYTVTGQSESIPIDSTSTTIADLIEWSRALFGLDGDNVNDNAKNSDNNTIQLFKDGTPLVSSSSPGDSTSSLTLQQMNIKDGDLIAVQKKKLISHGQQQQTRQVLSMPTPTSTSSGGLDFSNLLASSGMTASAAAATIPATSIGTASTRNTSTRQQQNSPPSIVYFPGMSLDEAITKNPHPISIATLLLSKEHLLKELNYHNPRLASKFSTFVATTTTMKSSQPQPTQYAIEQCASIWKEEMVKGGIQSALRATENFHMENTMKKRLDQNPADMEAIEYFQKKEASALINSQYHQMMEEYPEALGRVLMLYISVKINGTPIQAFCDTGAQATIMSKRVAVQCSIDHLIDVRFAGTAVGVGTGKILGRIHIVQLQINDTYYFPCTVTVMDDPPPGAKEMPFLLGLDMMKRHLCQVDLKSGLLKFYISDNDAYMEARFLYEKDLNEEQGGTIGFDPIKANEELQTMIDQMETAPTDDDEQEKVTKG